MGKQKMGIAVAAIEQHMANEVANDCEPGNNIYVELESRITEYEIRVLIETYRTSTDLVSDITLQPFKDFLANRWERIKGTSADYESSPNSFANLTCFNLAHSIARNVLGKTKASREEAMAFCVYGDRPEFASEAQRDKKLREVCAGNLKKLFQRSGDMIAFMTEKLDKKDWSGFIATCDFDALKHLFLGPGFINSKASIYDAITDLATDPKYYDDDSEKNAAKLFCLTEIYKGERSQDKEFTGYGGAVFGGIKMFGSISKDDRLVDADKVKRFLAGEISELNVDRSGHLGKLADQAVKLSQSAPADLGSRPRAMGGS